MKKFPREPCDGGTDRRSVVEEKGVLCMHAVIILRAASNNYNNLAKKYYPCVYILLDT